MIDQIYLSNYQVLAESERRLVIPIQTDADKIVVVSENLGWRQHYHWAVNKLLRIIVAGVFIICFFWGLCQNKRRPNTTTCTYYYLAAMPMNKYRPQCPFTNLGQSNQKDWELAINSLIWTAFYLRRTISGILWMQEIKGTAGDGLGEFLNLTVCF